MRQFFVDPGKDAGRQSAMKLSQLADVLQKFSGADLTDTLSKIEGSVRGLTLESCNTFLAGAGATGDVLSAAASMKRLAGQINVAIHATGILLCLPHILEEGEIVEYVSLGAGNTGRAFDLETNKRVAEFKFITWRGGPESIRQNSIFKDFYLLAESGSSKQKYLYVLDTHHPLKFFKGGRALDSVLSRNVALKKHFQERFGVQFRTVRDYFEAHKDALVIADVSQWVPELIADEQDGGDLDQTA